MTATPGKSRQSGIPAPSGIQPPSSYSTPGIRSRSTSTVSQYPVTSPDVEFMTRAFADAIKANDPAQHRSSQNASLSPQSASLSHFPLSGRHSTTGRPSSAASSSSAVSAPRSKTPAERPRTPGTVRPPSRHSDVFGRSSSRAGRAFEVGDNVRIESLGYEGTLKYIGEIEGKLGLWAGVELCGGFAGKGKNNGSVNGNQYFICPPNCGVFVATSKLSPPTVGFHPRPSSVASSRGGRATPSLSGRVTPSSSISMDRSKPAASLTNGRVTPSNNGRVTPSMTNGRVTPGMTPGARPRRIAAKPVVNTALKLSTQDNPPLGTKITAGSRASKYIGMTAKQLTTRDLGASPRRAPEPESPRVLTSPTRQPSSPFITPKAGRLGIGIGGTGTTPSKGRPPLSTARGRVPSAIAMPPPSLSPRLLRSVSLNDQSDLEQHSSADDAGDSYSFLEKNGKSLQDKISRLMSGKPATPSLESPRAEFARPPSTAISDDHLERLQARLGALEFENERLRSEVAAKESRETDNDQSLETLKAERDRVTSLVEELQSQLLESGNLLKERDLDMVALRLQIQETSGELERTRADEEIRIKETQVKIDENENTIRGLEELVSAKESAEKEKNAALKDRDDQLQSLQNLLDGAYVDHEQEKKELGAQIDELRHAGQETIALYEERLNAADSKRYELEDRIISLEASKRAERTPSKSSISTNNISAAEIDNETLRDQLLHLQRKVTNLEEALEDANTAAEREEGVMRERIKRAKEKEDVIKKELGEGRKEVERMLKSEANARSRVEEIEEALRESTLALENAQAEVEGLRAELDSLDGLVEGGIGGDLQARFAEVAQKASAERARFTDEIASLTAALEEFRAENDRTPQKEDLAELNQAMDALSARNSQLEAALEAYQEKEKKYDGSGTRDEIKGLKQVHIVQDLQKENLFADQRIKILESENKLLLAEAEQLRQDLKLLEDNLEQSITREEQALESGVDVSSGPQVDDNQPQLASLKQQKQKLEAGVCSQISQTSFCGGSIELSMLLLPELIECRFGSKDSRLDFRVFF